MALVDRLRPALPVVEPRLLARAVKDGRTKSVAVEVITAVIARPHYADPIVRAALREARQLHSAERRLVSDGVYAWIRHGAWLRAASGRDDAEGAWLAWLGQLPLIEPSAEGLDDVAALMLFGNLPRELARALIADLEDPVGFLVASNERAPLVLRVNTRRTTRERLGDCLAEEGLETRPGALSPHALIAGRPVDVHTLRSFRDGEFEVQDEGSQMVVVYGEPRGRVIDVCAGAGGKTLHAACVADGPFVAFDVRGGALDELSRRARRAGVRVDCHVGWPSVAPGDTVIVDAPCTGTGTLRRRPEVRFQLERLDTHLASQRELLRRASRLVVPGGRLIYATCSVLRSESEHVVEAFLGEARFVRARPDLRLGPATHGCDGMYVAVLEPV